MEPTPENEARAPGVRNLAKGTVKPSASVWHGRTGDMEVRDTVAVVTRAARIRADSPTAQGE